MLAHLPLTAAVAAMGAAMVTLVEHAHNGYGLAPAVWLLCAATAVVLCGAMAVAASLQAWHEDPTLYRRLAATCAAVALLCLALAAVRPAPLVLVGGLVVLLAIPSGVAVARYGTDGDMASD
jgi:hypothetical protein